MSAPDMSFFTWDLLHGYVLKGLAFSVELTVIAMLGGMALGITLALMRLSNIRWLALASTGYIDAIRSVPLVMVILWFFLIVPFIAGRPVGAELSSYITFTLFEGAYYAEIVRAGINGVPRGQMSAGHALGLTYAQNMAYIVLPQALRNMLPVLLTQTIILFQDTSLVYAVGAYDLFKAFDVAGKNLGHPEQGYIGAAITYLAVCYALSRLARTLAGGKAIVR